MSDPIVLSERQEAALWPFLREARALDREGYLEPTAHMQPLGCLRTRDWLALLYAFESLDG